ncbi:hypothetical protein ACFL96_07570 [Thermoproteota archaeon]
MGGKELHRKWLDMSPDEKLKISGEDKQKIADYMNRRNRLRRVWGMISGKTIVNAIRISMITSPVELFLEDADKLSDTHYSKLIARLKNAEDIDKEELSEVIEAYVKHMYYIQKDTEQIDKLLKKHSKRVAKAIGLDLNELSRKIHKRDHIRPEEFKGEGRNPLKLYTGRKFSKSLDQLFL